MGTTKGGAAALRERLGLSDLMGATKPSGGGLATAVANLKRDLGLDNMMGATGGTAPTTSGTTSYVPQVSQGYQAESYEPMVSMPSFLQPSTSVSSTSPLSAPMSIVSDKSATTTPTSTDSKSVPVPSMPVIGTAASTGKDSLESANPRSGAALDVWERMAAQRENRPVRTTNLFGEDYEDEGSLFGNWDNQLDYVGNTPTTDTYLRKVVESGDLSMDDAWAILHRPTTIEEESEMRRTRNVSPDLYRGVGTVIDDGTSYDYAHMTSGKMTGAQYKKYVDMGMGGMPVERIDPARIYDKRQEAVNNGFIPFTPDTSTMASMVMGNVIDTPSKLGTMVGNLREKLPFTDYSINIGDKKISGRDFDKKSQTYMNQYDYYDYFDPSRYLSAQSASGDGGSVTPHIREFVVPDANGRDTYHYGGVTSIIDNGDGTYEIGFGDGSVVNSSPEAMGASDNITMNDDGTFTFKDVRVPVNKARGQVPADLSSLDGNLESLTAMAEQYGGSPLDYAEVLYIPDLVMSDGTKVPYYDAKRTYWDELGDDGKSSKESKDISYDFASLGPLSNKPRRLSKQELFKNDESSPFGISVDLDDALNNVVDWTLGSLPISAGKVIPWIYSGSGAASSIYGIDPAKYDPETNSWGLQAGGYDDKGNLRYGVMDKNGQFDEDLSDSTKWWNALGSLAVPLTEMLVGPVGEHIVPLEKLSDKIPASSHLGELARNALIGAIGEGVEEDLGNVFDELTQYGPSGAFANALKNANGEDMHDMYGHEVRDLDTPAAERVQNFLNPADLLNSFAGGVGVDALLNMIPTVRSVPAAIRADNARRATGVQKFVQPENLPEDEDDERWQHLNIPSLGNEIAR